jgi:hypothetical protein
MSYRHSEGARPSAAKCENPDNGLLHIDSQVVQILRHITNTLSIFRIVSSRLNLTTNSTDVPSDLMIRRASLLPKQLVVAGALLESVHL